VCTTVAGLGQDKGIMTASVLLAAALIGRVPDHVCRNTLSRSGPAVRKLALRLSTRRSLVRACGSEHKLYTWILPDICYLLTKHRQQVPSPPGLAISCRAYPAFRE
jgi:hypothetical protein